MYAVTLAFETTQGWLDCKNPNRIPVLPTVYSYKESLQLSYFYFTDKHTVRLIPGSPVAAQCAGKERDPLYRP